MKLAAIIFGCGLALGVKADNGFTESSSMKTGFYYPLDVAVAMADFDNDGKMDIALGSPDGVRIFKGTEKDYAEKGHVYSLVNNDASLKTGIDAGDINNDGKIDIVYATPEGVRLLINKGSFKFEDKGLIIKADDTSYVSGCDVKLKDLNNDGKLDIVFATSGSIKTYLQD